MLGWAGIAAVWVLHRAAHAGFLRRAEASGNPRSAVGLMSVSLIGRVWLLALAVLVIGLIDRDAGLPAALLTAVVFQVWFTAFVVGRSSRAGPGARRGRRPGVSRKQIILALVGAYLLGAILLVSRSPARARTRSSSPRRSSGSTPGSSSTWASSTSASTAPSST